MPPATGGTGRPPVTVVWLEAGGRGESRVQAAWRGSVRAPGPVAGGCSGSGVSGAGEAMFLLGEGPPPSLCSLRSPLPGRQGSGRHETVGTEPQMRLRRGPRGPWLCGRPSSARSQRRLSSAGLLRRAPRALPHSVLERELLPHVPWRREGAQDPPPQPARGRARRDLGLALFPSEPSLLRRGGLGGPPPEAREDGSHPGPPVPERGAGTRHGDGAMRTSPRPGQALRLPGDSVSPPVRRDARGISSGCGAV